MLRWYSITSQEDPLLLKSSYSVEDESTVFGLDSDGSLVFIRFKVPSDEQLEDFMELFDSPTDMTVVETPKK